MLNKKICGKKAVSLWSGRKLASHIDDCYFVIDSNVEGFKVKNKIVHRNVNSVSYTISSFNLWTQVNIIGTIKCQESIDVVEPDMNDTQLFTQVNLFDITQDVGLSVDAAQLSGSNLHSKYLTAYRTQICLWQKTWTWTYKPHCVIIVIFLVFFEKLDAECNDHINMENLYRFTETMF